jgi:hypothetical protein
MKRFGNALVIAVAFAMGAMGCGDDEEEEDGKTSFGCEQGSAADPATHSCTDYIYTNLPEDIFETAKGGCTASGGTLIESCDTTGSVGGCRTGGANGEITQEITIWHYTGDEESETELCADLGDEYVYVAP